MKKSIVSATICGPGPDFLDQHIRLARQQQLGAHCEEEAKHGVACCGRCISSFLGLGLFSEDEHASSVGMDVSARGEGRSKGTSVGRALLVHRASILYGFLLRLRDNVGVVHRAKASQRRPALRRVCRHLFGYGSWLTNQRSPSASSFASRRERDEARILGARGCVHSILGLFAPHKATERPTMSTDEGPSR